MNNVDVFMLHFNFVDFVVPPFVRAVGMIFISFVNFHRKTVKKYVL